MLRMTSVEQKTIELLALVKLRAIIIQTILRKMRSTIGVMVEQGGGAESAISVPNVWNFGYPPIVASGNTIICADACAASSM